DRPAREGQCLAGRRDEDEPRAVGDGEERGAIEPSLEPTAKVRRGDLQKLQAALPGNLPSYRPAFEVRDLGRSLGVAWGDAKLPQHLATALHCGAHFGAKPAARHTR